MYKELNIEGFGSVLYQPVGVVEQELENVAPDGSSLTRTTVGERAKTVYKTTDGTEIPGTQVCKKLEVDGETVIVKKFMPTKDIAKEDTEVTEDKDVVWNAIDRKFYIVKCNDNNLKRTILDEGKTITFPFSAGAGFKVWKAALTNWNGKVAMVLCRGNISKAFESFTDEEVEINIPAMDVKNQKKLLKAIAMV
jgi:hypothetical protein